MSLTNPWVILTLVAMLVGATGLGAKLGSDHQIAKQAKTEVLIAKVKEQAQLGAAEAISKIDINHTTINRRLEKEIRENTIYRDCISSTDAERLLDNARGNRAVAPSEASVPPGTGRSESP